MAQVFQLVRNSVVVKLQDTAAPSGGNPRIMPRTASDGGRGWVPNTAQSVYGRQPDPVRETIPLEISATAHDDIAAAIQDINDYMQRAVEYDKDPTQQHAVYLVDQLTGETTGRQAVILNGRARIVDEPHGAKLGASFHAAVELALTRMPYWEAIDNRVLPSATPAAAASIAYDYTLSPGTGAHDIVGDSLARLVQLNIRPQGNSDRLGRLWIGTRSANKHGTLTSFKNIWELEDGTNGTDATDVGDGTASGGNAVDINPGTTTWVERLGITLDDISADEEENFGSFLWLLRAKRVDGGTGGTWEVQLRWGYEPMSDDDFIRGPIVEVKSTNWEYHEMGIQKLPLRNLQTIPITSISSTHEGQLEIQLWARRTAGVTNDDLLVDCLCPVPVDESWLVSDFLNGQVAGDGATFATWIAASSPKNARQAVVNTTITSPTTFSRICNLWTDGLGLPIGDGRMIIVYSRRDSSDITDTIGLTGGAYTERWEDLRGAE